MRAAIVADGYKRGEIQAHGKRVHADGEAADHTALQHFLHAFMHRCGGQAHLSPHLGVRTTAIFPQGRKNFGVGGICLNICLHWASFSVISRPTALVAVNFTDYS